MAFSPFPRRAVKSRPKTRVLVSHTNQAAEQETGIATHGDRSVWTPGGRNNLRRRSSRCYDQEATDSTLPLCVRPLHTGFLHGRSSGGQPVAPDHRCVLLSHLAREETHSEFRILKIEWAISLKAWLHHPYVQICTHGDVPQLKNKDHTI